MVALVYVLRRDAALESEVSRHLGSKRTLEEPHKDYVINRGARESESGSRVRNVNENAIVGAENKSLWRQMRHDGLMYYSLCAHGTLY